MAKSSQDMSSKRLFHWTKKVSNEDEETPPNIKSCSNNSDEQKLKDALQVQGAGSRISLSFTRKKLQAIAASRVHSVLTAFAKNRTHLQQGLGQRVVGTLFGYRRGHVHFVFQKEPNSTPALLIELATPITGLVREMASGLVRIALECSKKENEEKRKCLRLLEEPMWRTFCNGKKSGYASRKECGPREWKVLKALRPISMGAGVLPAEDVGEGEEDEIMYMRAKFERVVGSRDSEAFYMMNPDSHGAPELSVYLLRV